MKRRAESWRWGENPRRASKRVRKKAGVLTKLTQGGNSLIPNFFQEGEKKIDEKERVR